MMKTEDFPIFKPRLKAKTWKPEIEPILFRKWQEEGIFKFNENSDKPLFSIDTLPRRVFQTEKIIIRVSGYFSAFNHI